MLKFLKKLGKPTAMAPGAPGTGGLDLPVGGSGPSLPNLPQPPLPTGGGRKPKAKKPTGSYTNTHESGKRYHGKGPRSRAEASARRVGEQNDDPAVDVEHKPAPSDREAFKDEARRIEEDGGIANPDNYNKINSPGKKYLEQDEGKG